MRFLQQRFLWLKYSAIFLISFLGFGLLSFLVAAQENINSTCKIKVPIGDYCFDSLILGNQLFNIVAYSAIIIGTFLILVGFFNENIFNIFQGNIFKQEPITDRLLESIRSKLIKEVKTEIELRQSQSLYELNKVNLEIEDCPNYVDVAQPERVAKSGKLGLWRELTLRKGNKRKCEPIKPPQTLISIFNKEDVQGKLLILGEPGSGKTTELLNLASDLIDEAYKDRESPVPIIFELSSWDPKSTLFDNWLCSYIKDNYYISEKISSKLLKQQKILPLLDGLDELVNQHQSQCIKDINNWTKRGIQQQLIVCCRLDEYENSNTKLVSLNHAIYLEPLSEESIQIFLEKINRVDILQSIEQNQYLLELARKPLYLTLLLKINEQENFQESSDILDTYILSQLNKRRTRYKSIKHLRWLAQVLESNNKNEFLIEEIQANSLNYFCRAIYITLVTSFIIVTSCFSLLGLFNIESSLIIGVYYGLILGFIFSRQDFDIGLPTSKSYTLNWKLVNRISRKTALGLVIVALLVGISSLSSIFITAILLIIGLGLGQLLGVIIGLSYASIFGIISIENPPEKIRKPNQGTWMTLGSAIALMIIIYIIFPPFTLIIGLVHSRWIYSPLKHFAIRILLFISGDMPWNYAKFLAYTRDIGFIQQVGGRYRFTHNLLRKHFANIKDYPVIPEQ